jgi:hypothetical protein
VALLKHAEWFQVRFGRIEPDWYLFPFSKSKHRDPTHSVTPLKAAWKYVKNGPKYKAGFTTLRPDTL